MCIFLKYKIISETIQCHFLFSRYSVPQILNKINQLAMIQGKNKGNLGRLASPFPFSAYAIKSYSSQSPDYRPRSKTRNNDSDQQEFLGLIKGLKVRQTQILQRLEKSEKLEKITKKQIIIQNCILDVFAAESDAVIKRPIYRTRQKKVVIPKNIVSLKSKVIDHKGLIAFYRYQLVSLLTVLNRKEDYVNTLRGKNTDMLGDPLKSTEIDERFQKIIDSKGKDKGRVKFNHITNQQLRNLKYKPKQPLSLTKKQSNKQQYDDQEQQEEDNEQHQKKITDFQTWKKVNGVGYHQKVFIIKGGYHELRRGLIQKGWYQNEDVWSPFFDLKWTTKINDIYYMDLKPGQAVNHFNNNHHLTSKFGLTRRLRTLFLSHQIDVDKFYPRCFDLGDQVDFENFVENFKFGFAESVARRFLVDKKRYEDRQLKIRITIDILKRRTMKFGALVASINKGQFPTISSDQWQIITETSDFDQDILKQKLEEMRKGQSQNPDDPEYQKIIYEKFHKKVQQYLEILKNNNPQIDMNGFRNVWIVKPNFMSRGRGIRCFNNIYDICDYCLGRDIQYVAQKYIEHPLLIEGKKFDIRQWVLIQDFNPPKIWFYQQCYIRFCADDFSLDNIYNRFIHLTNNSVQKYNKNNLLQKSMCTMKQFADIIGQQKWKIVQEKIKNIVVWSIKACEGHVTGKKGSCQLVGYDFMIDQHLNPWLIEINMSPSMDYSTPVTKKLVKMVLQDTAKVIGSNKKNKNTGLFNCIYRGNEDLDKFSLYKL